MCSLRFSFVAVPALVLLLVLPGCVSATPSSEVRPIALVYKNDTGQAGCNGCAEAVAALLQSDAKWNFDVRYVGPQESLSVQSGLHLPNVKVFAQPGGNGSLDQAYEEMKGNVTAIQNFVHNGGRYLGFCLGGYLAGATPGYKLLPGDTDEYITSPGATVTDIKDTVIQVSWRGQTRWMYFQDGPDFILDPGANATILSTYTNGQIAALVTPYGNGKVGVVGPHPEADAGWYSAYHLTDPDGMVADLGRDLIDTTMQ